jgi:hypothetical protein
MFVIGLLTAVEGVVADLKKFQRATREGFSTFLSTGFSANTASDTVYYLIFSVPTS